MPTGYGLFLSSENLSATLSSAYSEPYALSNGLTLKLKINGGSEQTITFLTADFIDITNATATEISAIIDRELDDCRAFQDNISAIIKLATLETGNTATLEITGGTAQYILGFPTGIFRGLNANTFEALPDPQGRAIDINWVNYGVIGFGRGTLRLNANQEGIEYTGSNIIDAFSTTGTIRFRYRPHYQGTPTDTQNIWLSENTKGSGNNLLKIFHDNTGKLGITIHNNLGTAILTTSTNWHALQNTWHWIEVAFDTTSTIIYIFVNGRLILTDTAAADTRTAASTYFALGNSWVADDSAFDLDALQVFDTVQHITDFEEVGGPPVPTYATDLLLLGNFNDIINQTFTLDYIRDNGTPTITTFASPTIHTLENNINDGLWDGQIKILAKQGEYAREHDDLAATVIYSNQFQAGDNTNQSTTMTTCAPGIVYYFTLFIFSPTTNNLWLYDTENSFSWAFPFDQWDHSQFLFNKSPKFAQRLDESGDWFNWLSIFGNLLDGQKTEIEQLLTFYDMYNVRADLIPHHDYLINWPTNYELSENDQRIETLNALSLWKIKGRKTSISAPLEQVTNYNIEVVDGWKYVLLHNDADCVHPDTTDPNYAANRNKITDLLKYHPDIGYWRSTNGWGFFFLPIEGISDAFTMTMVRKLHKLAPIFIPSWTDYGFIVECAAIEESIDPPDEECELIIDPTESPLEAQDESFGRFESPYAYLIHNHIENIHNDRYDRYPHSDFYLFPGNLCILGRYNDTTPSFDLNHVRDGGSIVGTISGSPAISTPGRFGIGYLNLTGTEYITYSGANIIDNVIDYGAIDFWVQPFYSGTSATNQYFCTLSQSLGSSNNLVMVYHNTSGNICFDIYSSVGSLVFAHTVSWSPTANTWYHISANWDINNGASRLFIDGTQQGATQTNIDIRSNTLQWIGIGRSSTSSVNNNFGLDQIMVYDRTIHTTDFTPVTREI